MQIRFLGEGLVRDQPPSQVLIRWLPGDRSATLVDDIILCTDTTLAGMLRRATVQVSRG